MTPALKKADDLPAVVEIAGEAVEFPRQDGIGFALFDAAKHVIEDLPARLLGALAFGERPGDVQLIPRGDGVQLGKLRVNREHLTVFVLREYAAVNEVFKHGQNIL